MKCKICGAITRVAFREKVMKKHDAVYRKCDSCGFLCAEDPCWLEEAYKNPITNADTGLLQRNLVLSRKIAVLLYYQFNPLGNYLDYAGGYGIFTRLMRDAGFNFFHTDPYTENLFAKEFEWNGESIIDGVTCFECVEHLANPMEDLRRISSISKTIFFTTELLPKEIPSSTWDYYGFNHGQHISFYSEKTLDYIARELGCYVVSTRGLHLFSPKKVNKKKMGRMLKKTNRTPHPLQKRTTYDLVARNMLKLRWSTEK